MACGVALASAASLASAAEPRRRRPARSGLPAGPFEVRIR